MKGMNGSVHPLTGIRREGREQPETAIEWDLRGNLN